MTANHVLYIPAMLLIGMFLGAMLGKRQALREMAERERVAREREERRAARRAQRGDADASDDDQG